MIKFINKATLTPMWVADERKDEYLEAGHKLASSPSAKTQVEDESEEDEQPKAKKPVKKVTAKKR